jgi:hypothetical protein
VSLAQLTLRLHGKPGPLRPQIEALLQSHGEPLRWAITQASAAPDGSRELVIEAMVRRPSLLV